MGRRGTRAVPRRSPRSIQIRLSTPRWRRTASRWIRLRRTTPFRRQTAKCWIRLRLTTLLRRQPAQSVASEAVPTGPSRPIPDPADLCYQELASIGADSSSLEHPDYHFKHVFQFIDTPPYYRYVGPASIGIKREPRSAPMYQIHEGRTLVGEDHYALLTTAMSARGERTFSSTTACPPSRTTVRESSARDSAKLGERVSQRRLAPIRACLKRNDGIWRASGVCSGLEPGLRPASNYAVPTRALPSANDVSYVFTCDSRQFTSK